MEYRTKFAIGDTVYIYDYNNVFNKCCPSYGGSGVFEVVDKCGVTIKVDCSVCEGTGNVRSKKCDYRWSTKREYHVVDKIVSIRKGTKEAEFKISRVIISENGVSYDIDAIATGENFVKKFRTDFTESKIFSNKEECQAICDKLNENQEFD